MNAGSIKLAVALALVIMPTGRAVSQEPGEEDVSALAYERSGNFVVSGRVSRVDPVDRKLVIARDNLPAVELFVPGDADVRDGKDVGLDAIDEGELVRASFNLDGATPVAVDVRATEEKSNRRANYRRHLFRWSTEAPP